MPGLPQFATQGWVAALPHWPTHTNGTLNIQANLKIQSSVEIFILFRGPSLILKKAWQSQEHSSKWFTFGWREISWDKCLRFRHRCQGYYSLLLRAECQHFKNQPTHTNSNLQHPGHTSFQIWAEISFWLVDPLWSWRKQACTRQGCDTHLL